MEKSIPKMESWAALCLSQEQRSCFCVCDLLQLERRIDLKIYAELITYVDFEKGLGNEGNMVYSQRQDRIS